MGSSDFARWLGEKLRDGSLVAEWDESLVGTGVENSISEEALDEVIEFAIELANGLSS